MQEIEKALQQHYTPEMEEKLTQSLRQISPTELEVYRAFYAKQGTAGEHGLALVQAEMAARKGAAV